MNGLMQVVLCFLICKITIVDRKNVFVEHFVLDELNYSTLTILHV